MDLGSFISFAIIFDKHSIGLKWGHFVSLANDWPSGIL
jgi:hypothetical protein